jgi:DNA polymerase-3 subunit epsilon/ATP-dependent DNA helicase DinG
MPSCQVRKKTALTGSLSEIRKKRSCGAPLRVGETLDRLLFSQRDCVVLTSATLSTEGSFGYTKQSLGLQGARELMVSSPFDYQNAALVYLPMGLPDPGHPRYQHVIGESIAELCKATEGRTLVLFTAHASLRATHAAIQGELEAQDILVLGQGIDGSPKQLLRMLKGNPRSVLLGTAALWEGIDVVGETLSTVVITKLPFSVPTDPIVSARCELYEDPFNQYSVPQAILKFKQGFGRLIRSGEDRGAMVLLDSRLQTKRYGESFLDSLPLCTIIRGPLRQMSEAVTRWLRRDED